MKLSKKWLVWTILFSLFIFGAGTAGAEALQDAVASCFPDTPPGYTAEKVNFETPLGNTLENHLKKGLVNYLKQGNEISRTYNGTQNITISLMGNGLESYQFAISGQTPGCTVETVAGRKGSVMYDEMFAVVVAEKVVVLYQCEDEWSKCKGPAMDLASKFDYKKLELLLKK